MSRITPLLVIGGVLLGASAAGAQTGAGLCLEQDLTSLRRNATEHELRCRFAAFGPGRFGLLSYADVPVYQPTTPMPGTHVVAPGHARPHPWESYEEWEWRVLRTEYGAEARRVERGLELLHPFVGSRIMQLEARLTEAGVHFRRRETWRAPVRQAFLFQQGRSRPGPLATGTLTSWHSQVDEHGAPAGRAVDYDVPAAQMRRFHEIVAAVGLTSFGHDSYDPGHVFLPDPSAGQETAIAMLRLLPRIPEVTLATGLPTDRPLPAGGREALRQAARSFATFPFLRHPTATPQRPAPGARDIVELRAADRRVAAKQGS